MPIDVRGEFRGRKRDSGRLACVVEHFARHVQRLHLVSVGRLLAKHIVHLACLRLLLHVGIGLK